MFTHIDSEGRPKMVDISDKTPSEREATAQTLLRMPPDMAAFIANGDIMTKKGPVISTAIIAGTMAVKKTSELIPFCHPIAIDGISFHCDWVDSDSLRIRCTVKTFGKTGVEMEALTGASVAALTVYDMCKAITHDIVIGECRLLAKSGGKRDVKES